MDISTNSDMLEAIAMQKLDYALRVKRINDELLEQLSSSLRWLIHYTEKYCIPLPEKDKILTLINRTISISQNLPDQPKINTENINREDNRTAKQELSN